MAKPNMVCSVCKATVTLDKTGVLVYTCDHKTAPVVALMSATLEGSGGLRRVY